MNLESRNARALAAGQAAWDNASPAEDDGREDYVTAQAELLLNAEDSELVPFFSCSVLGCGFDEAGEEAIVLASDSRSWLLQLVIAVRQGDFELATRLAENFDEALRYTARKMVVDAMDKEQGE